MPAKSIPAITATALELDAAIAAAEVFGETSVPTATVKRAVVRTATSSELDAAIAAAKAFDEPLPA